MLGNIRPTNTRLISLSLKGVGEYLFCVDWQTVKLKFFVDWFVLMVQFSVYSYLKEDISHLLNSRTQAIHCHLSFDAYIKELLLRSVPIDALYIVRVNTHKFPKCTQFLLHEIYLHIPCKINLRNNLGLLYYGNCTNDLFTKQFDVAWIQVFKSTIWLVILNNKVRISNLVFRISFEPSWFS